MKISVDELSAWIATGSRMTGDKDTDLFLYAKKGKLYLAFVHPLIQYCKRIPAEGDLVDTCVSLPMLRPILANKTGDVELTVTGTSSLTIKGKGFKYVLETIAKNIPTEMMSTFFAKKGKETAFINITPKITKALKSIQDRVTDSQLSVRIQGDGNQVRFLLADRHHGLIITQELKKTYKSDEIIMPIDTFFKILSVASTRESVIFDQTDSDITVQSETEYLTTRLKETSNVDISFEMMDTLHDNKPTGMCTVKTDDLLNALSTCKVIVSSSVSAPVNLTVKDNAMLVSLQTSISRTSEKIAARMKKSFTASLNVLMLMETLSAMFDDTILTIRKGHLNLESSLDNVKMHGICVGYVEETDED